MNRLTLERHQVWVCLTAIISGLLLGSTQPALTEHFETLLMNVGFLADSLLVYLLFYKSNCDTNHAT